MSKISDIQPECRILTRDEHAISRRNIAKEALKVLYRLHRLGFQSYLVGGGVRDLLLGRKPKDFDVATNARPNRLKKIFRNCRVIGRRFRIVHVFFNNNVTVEVSTFRKGAEFATKQDDGLILQDNTFGVVEEDARRRDLTINGLFYDIATFSVVDFVGGLEDLRNKVARTIADPHESFREDPIRMIRVMRHAARARFTIDPATFDAIKTHKALLLNCNQNRLTEEIYRDFRGGASAQFFKYLEETGILTILFPSLADQVHEQPDHPLWNRLKALDARVQAGKEFSPAIFLCLLGYTSFMPTDMPAPEQDGQNRADIGQMVQRNIRSLRSHIHLPLQICNRIAQLIMAARRLNMLLPDHKLPKSFLEKAYLPEALDFYEIFKAAEGHPVSAIKDLKKQAEAAFKRKKRKRSQAPDDDKAQQEHRGLKKISPSSRRRRRRRRTKKKQAPQ